MVDHTCPCIACAYDLHGIDLHAKCPECGAPISKSYQGPTLPHCNAPWVRTIAKGQRRLAWACAAWTAGVILFCAGYTLFAFGGVTSWRTINTIGIFTIGPCLFVGFALLVSGGFLVTTRERDTSEALPQRGACRALLGAILVVGGVMSLLAIFFPLDAVNDNLPLMIFDGLLIVLGVMALVLAIKGSAYLARIAIRIPDAEFGRRVLLVARVLAVVSGLCALSVAPSRFKTFYWSDPDDRPFILLFAALVACSIIAAVWFTLVMLRLAGRLGDVSPTPQAADAPGEGRVCSQA